MAMQRVSFIVADLSLAPYLKGIEADLVLTDITRLANRYYVFSVISDNIESKKASDFTFIDHFDFAREFVDHFIVGFDRWFSNKDIIDINHQDNFFIYIVEHVRAQCMYSEKNRFLIISRVSYVRLYIHDNIVRNIIAPRLSIISPNIP
jgi:hypothetical protein